LNAIEVARLYFDAWSNHDPAAIVALFTQDGLYIDPNVPAGIGGNDLAHYTDGLFTRIPDSTFEIVTIGQTDDINVVVQWRMGGAGGKINLPGADFIQVQGNQIRRVQGYFDTNTMSRQIESS
jgi:ketosteroid isomerase-like protein